MPSGRLAWARDSRSPGLSFSFGDYIRANPRLFLHHVLTNLFDFRTVFFLLLLTAIVVYPWLRQGEETMQPASAFLFWISLPPLAGMILVYPRDHYAMVLLPSMILLAIQLFKPQHYLKASPVPIVSFGLILIGCLSVSVWKLRGGQFRDQRPRVDTSSLCPRC